MGVTFDQRLVVGVRCQDLGTVSAMGDGCLSENYYFSDCSVLVGVLWWWQVVGAEVEDMEYTPKPEFTGPFTVFNVPNEVLHVQLDCSLRSVWKLLKILLGNKQQASLVSLSDKGSRI